MRKNRKQAEIVRNRILVLMLAAVALLIILIVTTMPKQKAPTEQSSSELSSSVQPSSLPPETSLSESSSEPSSKSEPEVKSEASSTSAQESSPSSSSASPPPPAEGVDAPAHRGDMPILVNPTNKIPEGYKPDVVEMGNGYSFDRKGTEAYNAMAKAAKADGISLWVVSAYRSHEKQTTNFNNKIKEFQGMGYTATEAYAATAKLIAVPGTSEHSLGLALDLNSLETSFENTKAFAWLYKNCADYGFILRYPKDKTDITEISYEPWHYRYVGIDHAKVIMEKGICLEEYLSGDY